MNRRAGCVTWLLLGAAVLAAGFFVTRRLAARFPPADSHTQSIARGVTYRAISDGDPALNGVSTEVFVMDVDLRAGGLRVEAVADRPSRTRSGLFGEAHTVRDWCIMHHAVGGINGGFFGASQGTRKQVLGLLVLGDRVSNPGHAIRSAGHPDERFVRCALGFEANGRPHIDWLTGDRRSGVRSAGRPLNPAAGLRLALTSGIGCGPRLIAGGTAMVTDREERLVSPNALPRTFVAYDLEGAGTAPRPRHLLLAVASAMDFQSTGEFARRYFRQFHNTICAEAMCLDGGASSQLVYHRPYSGSAPDGYVDTMPALNTVPTAIVITSNSRPRR